MGRTFLYYVPGWIIAIVVFVLIVIMAFLGVSLRKRFLRHKPEEEISDLGPVQTSIFALMGLLLAFTFSMSASKFDERRKIMEEEINTIGTSILRTHMYNDSLREKFRLAFNAYIDTRIEYYEAVHEDEIEIALKKADSASLQIWKIAVDHAREPINLIRSAQMIPSLNQMIDIVTTREAARRAKTPPLIMACLLIMVLISSFLAGFAYKGTSKSYSVILAFALVTTIALYLIMEFDRPWKGLINLDLMEDMLVDLKRMVK